MQNHFKYVPTAAQVETTNFHTLRHTFATRCVEAGFDIKSLSEILGHSNVNITMNRYVHPTMELKRQNMQRLSCSFPLISWNKVLLRNLVLAYCSHKKIPETLHFRNLLSFPNIFPTSFRNFISLIYQQFNCTPNLIFITISLHKFLKIMLHFCYSLTVTLLKFTFFAPESSFTNALIC